MRSRKNTFCLFILLYLYMTSFVCVVPLCTLLFTNMFVSVFITSIKQLVTLWNCIIASTCRCFSQSGGSVSSLWAELFSLPSYSIKTHDGHSRNLGNCIHQQPHHVTRNRDNTRDSFAPLVARITHCSFKLDSWAVRIHYMRSLKQTYWKHIWRALTLS